MSTTTSTHPKPKVIKAKLGFGHQTAQNVLKASLNVYNNLFSSSFFTAAAGAPAPPVDQSTMKAANDALQAAMAAAAGGSKQAITARNHAKDAVVTILEQLATFVSVNSKGDMNAFTSSGFAPRSTAKTKTPPVSESIKKIVPAPLTGHMLVYLMSIQGQKAICSSGSSRSRRRASNHLVQHAGSQHQESGNRDRPDARRDLRGSRHAPLLRTAIRIGVIPSPA